MLREAERKREQCIRKQWKFKRSNGEIVVVRDLLEKFVFWVNKFKAVGDVAVQYDATGASLPWAAIRFLLQTTVNDVETFGRMVNDGKCTGLYRIAHPVGGKQTIKFGLMICNSGDYFSCYSKML